MFRNKSFAGLALTEDLGTLRNIATVTVSVGLVIFYLSLFAPLPVRTTHNIFIAFVLLPLLFAIRWSDFRTIHKNIELNGFCLLLLYLFLSHSWSADKTSEQAARLALRTFYIYGFAIAIYIFATRTAMTAKAAYWLLGGTAAAIAISLFYFYTHHPFSERFQAYGRFTNPNDIAILSAAMCAIALVQFSSQLWGKQIFFGIAALIFLICIMFSHSRSGLMALCATSGFIAIRLKQWKTSMAVMILIVFATIVSGLSIWTERGLSLRDGIWLINWHRLQECGILFGCGISTNSGAMVNDIMVRHTHSIPFGMLFYGGLIALSLYIALIGSALYKGWARLELPTLMLLAGVVGTLVTSHQIITSADPIWVYLLGPLLYLTLQRCPPLNSKHQIE